ncbi:MAG: stage II sporulation protein M [Labilithrix sp.]|nr:stage II sporulation protein M [Labilithrix sp.]MCW5809667.1 stage II sporulation protein M [Labilithrix sp.]
MSLASALTEKAFTERRRADWDALDALGAKAQRVGIKKLEPEEVVRVSPLYRSVCADLAAAQAARYSAPLVEYLLGLTAAAHGMMYGPHAKVDDDDRAGGRNARALSVRRAWLVAFPRAVRARRREMLLATALFFVPFLLGAVLTMRDPSFAFRVVPEAMLRPLTEAYAKGFGDGREAGEGALMAGFYVYNNVGIALRCFACGVFFGLGSAFYLVQNGLSIGAILGYVASQGAGDNIGIFIIGHGSLELGAIVLAGGAGLSIGWSIVAPGDLPRVVSLQRRAREILVIVAGAAVMLVMAAAIEGFWSASSAPQPVKLVVGATLFVLLMAYILLAGRAPAKDEAR